MRKRLITLLPIVVAVLMVLTMATPALANPPYPEGEKAEVTVQLQEDVGLRPTVRRAKPIDQPNIKDYLRNRKRQELLEAGQTAEANALSLTADDRVLVILVEFAGTDVFTWEAGVSTWDPYGRADPDEAVYDDDGNLIVGDCSNIITQTTVFTYTGPAHNEIPRTLSPDDRSADSIWTEDFSPEWFDDFMFGEGVVFDYTMQDGTPVFEDFTGQSVKDYYLDMSGGTYEIAGDVIGWLQVPHSTWYYDADECPGARSGGGSRGAIPGAGTARTLVMDALDAVNAISDTIPGFDWANYDLDGDGLIDRLWIVHSGYGEEDSSTLLNRTDYGEASVWSHSASVSPPYEVAPGISAGPYIMMPENGGIGVFAHEYGHNLGADDLYAYGYGETSTGFWSLMADDWTGHPIGFEPPAVDPWHLDNWGWLDPFVATDTAQVYEVTLGQASEFPGGDDVYRGAKIVLPDGVLSLAVPVWQGDYYWWGGKKDLANARMTTKEPIAIPAEGATLSFDLVYDIEDEWDFLWVQVSEDGETWNVEDTLTNENTQCVHDPSWIGGLYGFPEDLCGAGLGGFYGWNENWPDPEVQEFDLIAYAGQSIYLRFWFMTDWASTYTGAFVDNVAVTADSTVLFEDDAESGDAKWDYDDPWQRSDGTMAFTHNFYVQWRNVNDNGGYDSALGDERWRFGPANTGLLVWYNNNFYTDNEIYGYLEDGYGFGPKGRMLVVDAHPEPYRDPDVEPSWLGLEHTNLTSRGQIRDAPFTLQDTIPFTHTDPYRSDAQEHSYPGRPAVSGFHDSMGYYPGVADEGDGTYWCTVSWDASAAIPALGAYSLKAGPDYPGYNIIYRGDGWYGWWGWDEAGSGNPGDDDVQYGWHVELIEEAEDHTWATVRIWNSRKELDASFDVDITAAEQGDELTYTATIEQNIGTKMDALTVMPLTDKVEYVTKSAFGGAMPMPCKFSPEELAELYASGEWGALKELASNDAADVCSIVWTKHLGTGMGGEFGFSVEVTVGGGDIDMAASFFEQGELLQFEEADTVNVTARIFLPMIFKSYRPPTIAILHTNDFHGNLETDYKGRGGSAYMAGVLDDIRDEVGEDNVFLLDAGDVYLGAAPISQLLLGESAIDIYNMLEYDVAAYGNHEFDKGQDLLQTRTTQSDFPWVSANIVISGTDWTQPTWADPYVILSKGGVDLGVIGLTTDETPLVTLKGTTEGLVFKDLTETVLHYYDEVMAQADALIVLAHMGTGDSGGFKGLQTVAQELIDAGKPVDLMIAGHQHQTLYDPVMVGNTAIVGAGYSGRYLGRADVSVDPVTKKLTVAEYELITINNSLTPDPDVEDRVQYWADQVAPVIEQLVGYTNISLVRDYNAESNMGNLVTDSMLWKADQYDDGEVNGSVDIAFTNPGGLRADLEVPLGATLPFTLTWGDTFTVLPFGNTLYLMDLTGAQIQTLMDQSANLYKGIMQTSGAQWYWYNDCGCDTPTNWGAYGATVDGEPLNPEATYRVVTNDFLAGGQDGWVTFADGTNRLNTYYDMQEGANDYIQWYNTNVGPIDHEVEGRIVKLDQLITILHTSDTHGVWPTTDYYGTPEGLTYLSSQIAAERAKNPNTLLLDAGDTFQGNAFAQYFRNAATNPIAGGLNMLEYDAMTLGNHEFNFGPTTFATMLGQVDFPILGANVEDDGAYGFITDNVQDYITVTVGGVDVAILGLTNPRVPSYELPTNREGLSFYEATATAATLVPQIQTDEDPDLLIALTHIGYRPYRGDIDCDEEIAKQVPGIDVIVGGHSHTRLDTAVMVTSEVNPEGTLIGHAYRYAQYLGKIDIGLVSDGNGGYDVVTREGHLIPAGDMSVDAALEAYLIPFEAELETYTSTEIGQTTAPIDALEAYTEETTGANVQTDAAVWELTANGIAVDFHLSGAMSNKKVADDATAENPVTLTIDDMYTLMPYENSLVVMEMNGPQLKAVLERAYRNWWYYEYQADADPPYGGYSHYTTCMLDINEGGVITYNDTSPDLPDGNNVVSLVVDGTEIDFADANTKYYVGTVNYLAAGSCNFSDDGETLWPLDQITADTQYYVRDSVIDYLTAMGTISPTIEGRLQFVNLEPLVVLHTNDEHGWLQTFSAYGSPYTEGGAANLMARYTEIEGYSLGADGYLLTSGGDNWTGPSITTWFEGEPMVEVMNAMGYDVSVIGNHEFDFGRDVLNERIAEADYPFLSANIYYSGTTDLADFVTPYIVKDVGGVKVGLVGLTSVGTPTSTHPKNISDLDFGDYEAALRREVPNMTAEGAEVIIVVAHVSLGGLADLAANVGDLGIDLMEGGHSHELGTRNTNGIPIIGGGDNMQTYAKTVLFLDPTTHDVVDFTQSLVRNEYVTDDGNPVTPDATVQTIVDFWQAEEDAALGEVIGYTEDGIDRGSWEQRNYVTDSWLWAYPAGDFAMTNTGGFRADIDAGDITMGDIVGVLPFDNVIVDCAITGAQLVENLEIRHAAVGGFTYTYHEEDGQTVVDTVTLLADGSPLDMNATYHVLVNDFMYDGGDGFLFGEQDPDAYNTAIQWRQPVIDWTKEQNTSVANPIDALIDDQERATETP